MSKPRPFWIVRGGELEAGSIATCSCQHWRRPELLRSAVRASLKGCHAGKEWKGDLPVCSEGGQRQVLQRIAGRLMMGVTVTARVGVEAIGLRAVTAFAMTTRGTGAVSADVQDKNDEEGHYRWAAVESAMNAGSQCMLSTRSTRSTERQLYMSAEMGCVRARSAAIRIARKSLKRTSATSFRHGGTITDQRSGRGSFEMASWSDVSAVAASHGGERLSESMLQFNIQGKGVGRRQKVFMSYELMPPDFEFVRIESPIGIMSELEPEAALRGLGQLQVGALTYTPVPNSAMDDGIVGIGTTMPLALVDLTEPLVLMLYINILAQAADNVEQQIGGASMPDRF